MKLRKLRIHNFRGIIDQEITLNSYALLAGPNNAGKSTVIDAIRAFYEKDGFKFKPHNDFPFPALKPDDDESWVELTFLLTDDEHASLASDYQTDAKELRVRKYLKTSANTEEGKSATGSIVGYKTDGSLASVPFYGAKNVQNGKFGDLIYIPAISKVDDHAKLSGPSAMRDLLTDIMSDVVADGKAYGDFSSSISAFSEAIRVEKTADDRSLAGFESELNVLLAPWQTKFTIDLPPPSAAEIIKSMLAWELIDQSHGEKQGIDYFGSGFQRHFIYSLIQLRARYAGHKLTAKTKDFTPSLNLLLFEEPEAFLHPPQQELLARNLARVAAVDHWQVICATHSTHFVSRNVADVPAIIKLRRHEGRIAAHQISADTWSAIVDANQVIAAIARKYPKMGARLHEDDTKPEMEAVKNFLWLNPDRTSVFFANHVLLVEGQTEVALINRLVGEAKIDDSECGLYVLDCIGKYNIHRFMNLLGSLGVSHAVLHDDDHGVDEHAEVNQLIADSRHPKFTLSVTKIAGELEDMLGVPSAKASHRKPQHVLYQYETGQIDREKLQAFCALVESCLPVGSTSAPGDEAQ